MKTLVGGLVAAVSVVAMAAVLSVKLADGGEQPSPRQYQIECRFVEKDSQGQERVLASPTLVTTEGRSAEFRVGAELPHPQQGKAAEFLFVGTSCSLTVSRPENGRILLDVKLEVTSSLVAREDAIRLKGASVRVIEAVTLGRKLSLPLDAAGEQTAGRRLEVTVAEVKIRQ